MNIFDKLAQSLTLPLSGFGITNVSQSIANNLQNPIGKARSSSLNRLTETFGNADKFMAEYQNFEALYKQALRKELDSTALSASQRQMIKAAVDAPVINLNLIRNVTERRNLVNMFRSNVVNVEGLLKNFGAPGIPLQSSNLYRASSRYLIDRSNATNNHPVLTFLNSLTFNIDPKKSGLEAFSFGVTNLPSVSALRSADKLSTQISAGQGLFKKTKRPTKIFTFDVETSGLGVYDQVRSLAASTMVVENGKVVSHNADGFSTHFITPQMQQYTMRGADEKTVRLGTGVIQMEARTGDIVSDLTTLEGRRQAAQRYKDFMRQAVEADMVAGHNVQFDIQKITMSALSLSEFTGDKEAMMLHKQFMGLSEQGRVINTLDLARDYLSTEITRSLTAQGITDPRVAAQQIIETMFSAESLAKSKIGGSVTPFSVSNISAQTNLLSLIEGTGEEGAKLVADLAGRSE